MKHCKYLLLLLLCVLFASCSTQSSDDEPQDHYTFTPVLGRWESTSYLTSGGYFVPSGIKETFEFSSDNTFVHYNNGTTTKGEYSFAPESSVLLCKENGNYLEIDVEFADTEHATFGIQTKGATVTPKRTIKVERTRKPQ